MRPRIVITGVGVASALGVGQAAQVKALMHGISGIGKVRHLPTEHLEFPVGEVDLNHDELLDMLQIHDNQRYSRTSLLGMVALREALTQARLLDREDLAFVSGTTVGGMDVTERHFPEPFPSDMKDVHDCGANTNSIADYFGCFNYTSTVSTACSSAMNALITAKWLIESGERDIVVAGGSEALSLFHLNGFKSLLILDQEHCRPFDKTRAGLNLGEGAAYLVLEREEMALARHADILGVLSGVGNACDAYHQTASSENGEGGYRSMIKALEDAGIERSRIDYVNAHGTATPNNDMTESAALKRVFGEKLPPVSSTKSYTGHTTSASGSIEAVFCLLALQNGFLPFQREFKNPDASCIIPVSGLQCPRVELYHVMCNSFGFGGNDSTIILSRYE